ncbi:Phage protein [Bacillus thuringiensis serovar israelensis ATCC 35646]|nr:Phage protein [Bacillus thuringiensis serovar israelensis ATCC 35646]
MSIDEQIALTWVLLAFTLHNWRKKHPIMDQAVRRGKEVVDREVENALLKRALGYTYEEVTVEKQQVSEDDDFQDVETKRVKRQVAPDTTAVIFWLKNRKPDAWRDRREIDHSGEMKQTIVQKADLSKYTSEELKQLESLLKKSSDS